MNYKKYINDYIFLIHLYTENYIHRILKTINKQDFLK